MFRRQRVLVVDSSKYFDRALWQNLLPEAEFELAGLARSGEEAVDLATACGPDIVLIDLGRAGLRTVKVLHADQPGLPVVALTPGSFHDDYEREALEAGAAACLDKSDLAATLVPLIRQFGPGRASRDLSSPAGWISLGQSMGAGVPRLRAMVVALQGLPRYLIHMGLGLIGGAMGVALAIWLAIMVQALLPPTASFTPGPIPLITTAILMSIGASWLLNQVMVWLSPRLLPGLGNHALPIILVSSTSASLLQTLLFTRGW